MRWLLAVTVALASSGCGEDSAREMSAKASGAMDFAPATNSEAPARPVAYLELAEASGGKPGGSEPTGLLTARSSPDPVDAATPRKIIYTAEVALVVEEFAKAEDQLTRIVQAGKGYIADLQLMGSPGSKRSARWKVRVPVEQFEAFLLEVSRLGELERNNRHTEDVSESYYDLEARVKNKQVEEKRLQKILEENTGKIEDVLKVEAELSRVRGEIEQSQGRLRLLENLTSLTTVTIDLRERETYQPAPPVAASFGTQIQRTFSDSLGKLVDLGKFSVLFFVGLSVWLPIWLVGLGLVFLLARWLVRWLFRNGPRLWTLARTPIRAPKSPPA